LGKLSPQKSFAEDGERSRKERSRKTAKEEVAMTFHSVHDPTHLYFITASIVDWKHLFAMPEYATIPLNSFAWLQDQKRILLFAFVIMPSHLHAVIKPEGDTIGDTIQQFGSFTAHEVLKKLKANNQKDLIEVFRQKKRDPRHQHSIWQDIQAKNIYSADFLWQKMEYIHQNPVTEKWKLVENRSDYIYSSACYYEYGRKPIIPITDINEWLMKPPPGTAAGANIDGMAVGAEI
jgi:putative transposase